MREPGNRDGSVEIDERRGQANRPIGDLSFRNAGFRAALYTYGTVLVTLPLSPRLGCAHRTPAIVQDKSHRSFPVPSADRRLPFLAASTTFRSSQRRRLLRFSTVLGPVTSRAEISADRMATALRLYAPVHGLGSGRNAKSGSSLVLQQRNS